MLLQKPVLIKTITDRKLTVVCLAVRNEVILYNLLAKRKNKDHISCLSSLASRLLSEFFQSQSLYRGDAEFFKVPKHKIYREKKLRIFPSSRAFIQGVSYIRRLAPRFALPSPRAFHILLRISHIFLQFPSYFFIFPTYFFIFATCFFIILVYVIKDMKHV